MGAWLSRDMDGKVGYAVVCKNPIHDLKSINECPPLPPKEYKKS
jgi:hypothetical protein